MIRLLDRTQQGRYQLSSFDDANPPQYAILSHTWSHGHEVEYKDLIAGGEQKKLGYTKMRFCIDQAQKDGLQYCWIDTCCIDKSSSAELSASINSMFRWYQQACKCYVFLADVHAEPSSNDQDCSLWLENFRQSKWFKRGWTLQELLAPKTVEFFSSLGTKLGDKASLEQEVHSITGIPPEALNGNKSLSAFSVEDRMAWVTGRKTTVAEDKVYCLLGIFQVFLPLIYGEGETHAAIRLKEEIQKRESGLGIGILPSMINSPPIPFARNERFVGRERELQALSQFLHQEGHRRMTLYGLGGCGKTALAIEFAYAMLSEATIDHVYWLHAVNRESFESSYLSIGVHLRLPSLRSQVINAWKIIQRALDSPNAKRWLMIIDNADDFDVLAGTSDNDKTTRLLDYIPHAQHGNVLFTTRSRKVAAAISQSSILELTNMDQAEAEELLRRYICNPALVSDLQATHAAVEVLACLPLAIVQAAAFINGNGLSISGYLALVQQASVEIEMLEESFEDPTRRRDAESTVAKTWYVSFDQIRREDHVAAEYLAFMACLDRIKIPLSILPTPESALQQAKAVGTLTGYSLVTERRDSPYGLTSERFFDVHRLVHVVIAKWLESNDELAMFVSQAIDRLRTLVPYGGDGKEAWMRYLPHLEHLANSRFEMAESVRISLFERSGRCQSTLGRYASAESSLQRALSLRAQNPDMPDTDRTVILGDLARIFNEQGRYTEAESLQREVLTRCEENLGHEHGTTLIHMTNLTIMLASSGKFSEAESIARITLARKVKLLGLDHPETLISMGSLGAFLVQQTKYAEAESVLAETLARQEKVLRKHHEDTLTTMNNIARVFSFQGKMVEAESMQRTTFDARRKTLGPEHPYTLTSACNLATVLRMQGAHSEAEALCRQTLSCREKVLSVEHPDTLMSVFNLTHILASQQRWDEAAELYQRSYSGFAGIFGGDHITTRTCREQGSYILDKLDGSMQRAPLGNRPHKWHLRWGSSRSLRTWLKLDFRP